VIAVHFKEAIIIFMKIFAGVLFSMTLVLAVTSNIKTELMLKTALHAGPISIVITAWLYFSSRNS